MLSITRYIPRATHISIVVVQPVLVSYTPSHSYRPEDFSVDSHYGFCPSTIGFDVMGRIIGITSPNGVGKRCLAVNIELVGCVSITETGEQAIDIVLIFQQVEIYSDLPIGSIRFVFQPSNVVCSVSFAIT